MSELDTTYTACVIGSTPHRADEGYLCGKHLQRFADILRDIEDEFAALDARPSMQIVSGRSGGLPSHRSPARLDVIVATDRRRGTGHIGSDYEDPWGLDGTASVLDTLHSWARVVREERDLSEPTRPGVRIRDVASRFEGPFCDGDCLDPSCDQMTTWTRVPTAPTVSSERDLLSRHLTWIAAQEWVDECMKEFGALLGQLRATNGTSAAKALVRCYLPTSDGECGGPIHQDWVNGCAYCGECRSTWTGKDLADLNARMEELLRPRTDDGRVMMTVAQIVARFGGNANSVRVKLSRAGIKGADGYYDVAVFDTVTAC